MASLSTLLTSAGIGAGLMYFFDPDHGTRRRAQLEDRLNNMASDIAHTADTVMQDLRQGFQGVAGQQQRGLAHNAPSRGRQHESQGRNRPPVEAHKQTTAMSKQRSENPDSARQKSESSSKHEKHEKH